MQSDPEAGGIMGDDAKSDDFNYGYNFEFSEKSIRMGFIKKVYSILMIQLAVTMAIMACFMYIDAVRFYCYQNAWVWIVAFLATMVCIIALACCPDVRRKSPMNFIFLGIFTVCEGVLLGTVASTYNSDEVLIAAGITALVALALTIFAFQTKWDFTMMGGGLLVALIVLMCFGFLCAIFRNNYLNMFYAALGALIFGLYMIFDTQLMLGGKHKYALSPEEYIFAALNLYLDIVNLFMYILMIVGSARR